MARPKKPKYEYVEKLNLFRKRVKDIHGKYIAVYGRTPDERTEKLLEFNKQQEQGAENKDNLDTVKCASSSLIPPFANS